MLQVIKGIIEIILLFLKNLFEQDERVKYQREKLMEELNEAIKNHDDSALTTLLDKLNRM